MGQKPFRLPNLTRGLVKYSREHNLRKVLTGQTTALAVGAAQICRTLNPKPGPSTQNPKPPPKPYTPHPKSLTLNPKSG